jgi:hypothetical protein
MFSPFRSSDLLIQEINNMMSTPIGEIITEKTKKNQTGYQRPSHFGARYLGKKQK